MLLFFFFVGLWGINPPRWLLIHQTKSMRAAALYYSRNGVATLPEHLQTEKFYTSWIPCYFFFQRGMGWFSISNRMPFSNFCWGLNGAEASLFGSTHGLMSKQDFTPGQISNKNLPNLVRRAKPDRTFLWRASACACMRVCVCCRGFVNCVGAHVVLPPALKKKKKHFLASLLPPCL